MTDTERGRERGLIGAAHTPGPWRVCRPGSNFQKGKLFIRPSTAETLIATVSGELKFAEQLANAEVMAAAPDLLAALKMLLEAHYPTSGDGSHFWSSPYARPDHPAVTALAAIQKAEGRR